jgi:protein arginine kinase
MVLQDDRPPAWLAADAPHGDVVLSSRARVARNLVGYRFPHRADKSELLAVRDQVVEAFRGTNLEIILRLSAIEWEHWVGARLISVDFDFEAFGRSLILSEDRGLSVMINEEDHVRIQAISAGWSISTADEQAEYVERHLEQYVTYAESPSYGFLTASPLNAGTGKRLSAMFHLIGLAHQSKLPQVLKALTARGMSTRGLFGESSRAVGAFVQVSMTHGRRAEFTGACEYLLESERAARAEVGRSFLESRVQQTLDFIEGSPQMNLADGLRVLGWLRWASVVDLKEFRVSTRRIDRWLSVLELSSPEDDEKAARTRADFLRDCLSSR